ncbi:MAG: carboxypeptidase-like regulatory domain-containing protein [Flavobacteriales bacterium]|nr:carboxypeptidase-like regulatory domain-containing protein [Flavobacteriales bacterium]
MRYNLTLFLLVFSSFIYSQNKTVVEGVIVDEYNYGVPYAAIGILSKNLGTSSNDEGAFYFLVSDKELNDVLEISSIGFKTFKISIKDYISLNEKKIVLEENVTELSDVLVKSNEDYVRLALKNLKENTLNKPHQLKVLYRRWSVEDNICRYYIEHFINVNDRGPYSNISDFNITQTRNSADYRFVNNEQKLHALRYMEWNNPLRKSISVRSYKWRKLGVSNYDGEDVIILNGTGLDDRGNERSLKLFIGFDTYSIYKLEFSKVPLTGKSMDGIYVYKKNLDGKLYLSYHNREYKAFVQVTERIKNLLLQSGQRSRKYIPMDYRHEVFVIGVEEDKKMFDYTGMTGQKDMTLFKIPYDLNFWKNISLPPETKFYKENISELVSLYGVPIETQFEYSN